MSGSITTRSGGWKAPTRFFPASVSSPVFPPIELSSIAKSVVGTWTTGTPRRKVAATNPATSPTTPPPRAITAQSRPYPAASIRSWIRAHVSRVLFHSPAGKGRSSAARSPSASSTREPYRDPTWLSVTTA